MIVDDVEKLVKILKSFDVEWEIYWESASSLSLKFRKIRRAEIERSTYRVSSGIGLRILVGGKIGFSYLSGSDFSKDELELLVKRALKIAKISGTEYPAFPVPGKYPSIRGLYDKRIVDLSIEDLSYYGTELVNIEVFGEASIGTSTGIRGIMNSNGVEGSENRSLLTLGLYAYEKGKGSGSYGKSFRVLPDMEKVVEEIKETAMFEFKLSREAKKIEKYEGEIIIEPKALISFLSIFVPNVSAKSVYMKRSRFERLGVEVSSESFSIIDDPTIDEGLGSYSFDGEGNPGMRKFIIKDGVLTSFLSDQKYGSLLGIGSTGNAIRSYSSQPIIDSSNLLIPSGNETLDEGIFIRSVYGEHTANPITGDFSLNIELGYIVNNRGVKP